MAGLRPYLKLEGQVGHLLFEVSVLFVRGGFGVACGGRELEGRVEVGGDGEGGGGEEGGETFVLVGVDGGGWRCHG